MDKKLLLIYNPNSGKGRFKEHLDDCLKIFKDSGYDPEVYETKAPLDAEAYVSDHAHEFDRLVCAGGDGTLSEVVSGMMRSRKRIPIGMIAAGSQNDSAVGFKWPKDIKKAAALSISGREFLSDVGRLNDEYFTYVASFGALSAISCFTSQKAKKVLGVGAYLAEGVKQLLKMESYNMTVRFNDNEINGDFYLGLVTNAMSVGGFKGIAGNDVDLQDGLFEVLLLKKPDNIIEFSREVDSVLIHNKDNGEILTAPVIRFKTDKVEFISEEPVQWVRDGENGGRHEKAVILNDQRAVSFITGF